MKSIRKILCTCLVLVMCLSCALIASAQENKPQASVDAGAYGYLTGRIRQIPNFVNLNTRVNVNNDNAYLRCGIKFTNNHGSQDENETQSRSNAGETVYSHNFANYFSYDTYNQTVHGKHEVYQGSEHGARVAYTFYKLSKPFMK